MRKWPRPIMLGLTALVGACGSPDRTRYKMTVDVETPEGMRSGHAVRQVTFTKPPNIPLPGESRPQFRLNGEAVAVDLPGGQTLFALLSSASGEVDYAAHIPDRVLGKNKGGTPARGPMGIWPSSPEAHPDHNEKHKRAFRPMLVTFRDVTDPKSVEQADPANLAASFGPGVSLQRIIVEITDEPVTTGIGERLKWLDRHKGSLVAGYRLHPDNPEKDVTASAFRQGAR
jgi:hypothetical protein